jgi:hypothetical protein
MNSTTKKILASALVMALSGGVYAQAGGAGGGAGGAGGNGGGSGDGVTGRRRHWRHESLGRFERLWLARHHGHGRWDGHRYGLDTQFGHDEPLEHQQHA